MSGTKQDPADTVVKKIKMLPTPEYLEGYWKFSQVLLSYILTIDIEDYWDIVEVDSRVFRKQSNIESKGKRRMEDFLLGGEMDSDITKT